MSKNSPNSVFLKTLASYGFSGEVSPVLQRMDLVTETIPNDEDLIEIPDEEILPVPEIEDERVDDISESDMRNCALTSLANTFKEKNEVLFLPKVEKTHLKNILVYDDPADFVQFKREYATYIKKTAADQLLDEGTINLCSVPTCLNTAIPTMKYCTYHITMDPDYSRFGLFNTCQFKLRGEECETPCSVKFVNCTIHRKNTKTKK